MSVLVNPMRTAVIEEQLCQFGALETMHLAILPETKGFVVDQNGMRIPVSQIDYFGIQCEGFPEC